MKKEDSGELLQAYRLARAVAAYFTSGKVVRTVTLDARKTSGVEIAMRKNLHTLDAKRNHVELQILEAFCGGIAADCFSHYQKPEFDPNLIDSKLVDLARGVTGSDEECQMFLHWLWARSIAIFARSGCWFGVGNIANRLVEKRSITGDEARDIWDKAIAAAKE